MTHQRTFTLLLLPIIGCLSTSVSAQNDELKPFYLGLRLGGTNSMKISEEGNAAKIENAGLSSTALVGYKLNKQWSAEIGRTSSQDVDLFFVAGNDVNLTGTYLATNYTLYPEASMFFVRARAGLINWKARAEERATFLGFDISPNNPAGPYRNSGVSPMIGAELGLQFSQSFEWTIIGFDTVPSGDAQWTVTHTGIKFSL